MTLEDLKEELKKKKAIIAEKLEIRKTKKELFNISILGQALNNFKENSKVYVKFIKKLFKN